MHEAGLYADRLSVNIEIPTESGLKLLAPDKNIRDMIEPMNYLKNEIIKTTEEKALFKSAPLFAPAGQSTQMIIGASGESDKDIMHTAHKFYKGFNLKRVYYSGYVPISNDNRLPELGSAVPVLRENRLYQTDWLMRFYGFHVKELLNDEYPNLDTEIDPKLSWALRNLGYFPIDINKADLQLILRVPGIGLQSAQKIAGARQFQKLGWDHLKKIGIAVNRARYFITCNSPHTFSKDYTATRIRQFILNESKSKYRSNEGQQYNLFG
jgi:putative DNA modification/repair radical SAM protein